MDAPLSVQEIYQLLREAPGAEAALRLSAKLRRAAREGRPLKDGRQLTIERVDAAMDKLLARVERERAAKDAAAEAPRKAKEDRRPRGESSEGARPRRGDPREVEEEVGIAEEPPPARARSPAASSRAPSDGGRREGARQLAEPVANRIRWLNTNGDLQTPLRPELISEPLSQLDDAAALQVLDGAFEGADEIKDPNTFIVEAVRALLGKPPLERRSRAAADPLEREEEERYERGPGGRRRAQAPDRERAMATLSDVPAEVQEAIINNRFNYVDRVWSAPEAGLLPRPPARHAGAPAEAEEEWLRLPHVAVNGMTNCGKSTIINHALRWSYAAKASSVPGRTKSIDFYCVNRRFVLVDLPGYPDQDQVAHLGVAKDWQSHWEDLVLSYLELCGSGVYDLRLLLQLQATQVEPSRLCCRFTTEAQRLALPLMLIMTKDDHLKRPHFERNYFLRRVTNKLGYSGPHLHYSADSELASSRKARKQLHRFIRSSLSTGSMAESRDMLQKAWAGKAAVVAQDQEAEEEYQREMMKGEGGEATPPGRLAPAEGPAGPSSVSSISSPSLKLSEVLGDEGKQLPKAKAKAKATPKAKAKAKAKVPTHLVPGGIEAVRPASDEAPTVWRYKPQNGLPLMIRSEPSFDAQPTQATILPRALFEVCEEKRGASGVIFLRLRDGRGWVFDRKPGVGILCRRRDQALDEVEAKQREVVAP